jgi:hypothetical protein
MQCDFKFSARHGNGLKASEYLALLAVAHGDFHAGSRCARALSAAASAAAARSQMRADYKFLHS